MDKKYQNQLYILVIDLRGKNHLNHHIVEEIRPLLDAIQSRVQIIFLADLECHIHPNLSQLVAQKMDDSVRVNLLNHPTYSPSHQLTFTPSLSQSQSQSNSTPTTLFKQSFDSPYTLN
ncbi:hypothetical protein O181_057740 [Austropuccinia psidii MF-1]|uniref:Uncharacterized protein n=1 Tax=Austropuccinia psidii MF-1 TaxID=1389203 RepID=A0A9Q3E8E0_9BASI|nr:hypothetical protein [Austropuccinia psidii MF-1]